MKKIFIAIALFAIAMGFKNIEAQTDKKDTIFFYPPTNTKYDSIKDLETVVISSNHIPVNRRNAPSMVNVVDEKLIQRTNSVCVASALSYQTGIRVEDNCSTCGFFQARLNGLDGHYSQILINSRAVFSSVSNLYGLEQIPTNMISKIEILKGGGSALYGASAVGGTINIITKEPTKNSAFISHSLTSIDFSKSLDNVTQFNSSYVNKTNNYGINFFAQNRSRDGYSYFDDGLTNMPKLDVTTLGTRMFWRPSDFSKIDISYYLMKDDRRGGNKLDKPVEQANIAESSQHNIHNLNIDYHINSEDNRVHFDFYSCAALLNRKSYAGGYISDLEPDTNVYNYHSKTKDFTFLTGFMFRYRFDNLLFLPAYFTLGAEYNFDRLTDKALGFNLEDKQTTHIYSTYFQNEWTNKRWNILIGARLDKHNMLNNPVFSPRINIKFSPLESTDLRFAYSEGFRAPQIFDEDLHVSMAGGERFRIKLADNLKEERSRSFCLSTDYYKNIKNMKVNIMLEAFYTILSDVFAERATNKTDIRGNTIIERYNSDGAKYYGLSIEIKTVISKQLQTDMGFTAQKSNYNNALEWSENASTTKHVLRTAGNYGYLTIGYSPTKHWDFDLTGTYTGRMYCPHFTSSSNPSDRLEHTPKFFDMNIKAAYLFNIMQETKAEIALTLTNVFNSFQKDLDKGYDRDSDYIYGPSLPRSINASVSITF